MSNTEDGMAESGRPSHAVAAWKDDNILDGTYMVPSLNNGHPAKALVGETPEGKEKVVKYNSLRLEHPANILLLKLHKPSKAEENGFPWKAFSETYIHNGIDTRDNEQP